MDVNLAMTAPSASVLREARAVYQAAFAAPPRLDDPDQGVPHSRQPRVEVLMANIDQDQAADLGWMPGREGTDDMTAQ